MQTSLSITATTMSKSLSLLRSCNRLSSRLLLRPASTSSKAPLADIKDDTQQASKPLTDPWPIPLQAELPPAHNPEAYTPHPLDGMPSTDQPIETIRARLIYQTRKRGTLETGLLISTFATPERVNGMSKAECAELDRLLSVPEWTLYYWAVGKSEPAEDSEWRGSKLLGESSSLSLSLPLRGMCHLRRPCK